MQLTLHFTKEELACPCCGKYVKNVGLLMLLETVRTHFNKPVIINSAFRCTYHNEEVGGADNSQHLMGTAADIVVKGVEPSVVAGFLETLPYRDQLGIGRYKTFTHVDIRGIKARWRG